MLSGQYQGAATADLAMIPVASIDHIEVLQDGAAAQYGTDAIAGVVNIILKKNDAGGVITATGGQYYQGDGATYDLSGNIGFSLGSKGFLSITVEKRYNDYTQRGDQDRRLIDVNGVPATLPFNPMNIPNYPDSNRIAGNSEQNLTTAMFNAGYDLTPDVSLYATGSYGVRLARAFENVRLPNKVIAAATSNQQYLPAGTVPICSGTTGSGTAVGANGVNPCFGAQGAYTDPGEAIFAPNALIPKKCCGKTITATRSASRASSWVGTGICPPPMARTWTTSTPSIPPT